MKNKPSFSVIAYEYLLVTVPVGIYVALEATRKNELAILWRSPEWAIATIFLLFQGLSLYIRHLSSTGAKLSAATIGLLALIGVVITTTTLINAYRTLDAQENTKLAIFVRLALFVFASVAFWVFVAAAQLYFIKKERERNGQR